MPFASRLMPIACRLNKCQTCQSNSDKPDINTNHHFQNDYLLPCEKTIYMESIRLLLQLPVPQNSESSQCIF